MAREGIKNAHCFLLEFHVGSFRVKVKLLLNYFFFISTLPEVFICFDNFYHSPIN